tara:strand:+ start:1725 stop:2039 length:315 start_codon:yes stop_codon:yes gene_type:complete
MNIQILNPDRFVSLDKEIYIKDSRSMNVNTKDLVELATSIVVWLGSEEPPKRINSELAMSPSNLEIEMYLQDNVELRNLALELDLIYMRDIDIVNYLNYCNSYK